MQPAQKYGTEVPKHHSKSIPAASAANASGSLQTALSKVTRRSAAIQTRGVSRRVTSDRVLTFPKASTSGSPTNCPEFSRPDETHVADGELMGLCPSGRGMDMRSSTALRTSES